jgi:hypothetical protein
MTEAQFFVVMLKSQLFDEKNSASWRIANIHLLKL